MRHSTPLVQDLRAANCRSELGEAPGSAAGETGRAVPSAARNPDARGTDPWYIDTLETICKWQRSKQTHLEFLERHAIGKANALTLTSAMLIGHVRSRRADGTGPATMMNNLVWIGVVLGTAKSIKELPVRPEITQNARSACNELRLIGKARKRARRPTHDELLNLRQYFASRDRRATARSLQSPAHTLRNFSYAHIGPWSNPPPVARQYDPHLGNHGTTASGA